MILCVLGSQVFLLYQINTDISHFKGFAIVYKRYVHFIVLRVLVIQPLCPTSDIPSVLNYNRTLK